MSVRVDVSDLESIESGPLHGDLLEKLARQVEGDLRPYVKRSNVGHPHLVDSAATNSDFRAGRITYSATDDRGHEYASDAYWDPRVRDGAGQNPKASDQWDRKAEADLGDSWAAYAGDLIEEALRDS